MVALRHAGVRQVPYCSSSLSRNKIERQVGTTAQCADELALYREIEFPQIIVLDAMVIRDRKAGGARATMVSPNWGLPPRTAMPGLVSCLGGPSCSTGSAFARFPGSRRNERLAKEQNKLDTRKRLEADLVPRV